MNTQKQTLVRLTANSLDLTGKQGIFEGTFNDGILIKPNSQIALQSCSLSRDQDSFIVNSANNKISFQISQAGGLHEIILRNGLYDSDSLFKLLEDIQDKMNNDLDIAKTKEHNTFIEVKATTQNKVSFNFMLGKSQSIIVNPPDNDPTISGIHYSKNNGQNEITKGGAGTSQYLTGTANYTPITGTRQYIYSTIPFNQGAGLIKIRLDRFTTNPTDAAKSGAIIGLLPDSEAIEALLASENSNRKIVEKDYRYAICTNTDGQADSPYMVKTSQGGNFTATGISPKKASAGSEVNNDILMIKMTKGLIQLVIAQNGEGERVVFEEDLKRRDSNGNIINLLPYVGIFGAASQTRIGNSSISFNPEDNEQAGTNFEEPAELALGATPYPRAQARNTVYNLIFGKEDLANFLGFQQLEQNPAPASSTPNQRYVGNKELTKLFSTNTYLIEMLSEQLNSYDSFDGGRKNILAPIPLSDHVISNTGIIHYEPNNLMYINLRNDKEKLIRNMRCRIITNAYESINIEGLADICLLIRG